MKQLTIKDFSNAYEFKQAKKQAIKQCNALKLSAKTNVFLHNNLIKSLINSLHNVFNIAIMNT